MLLLLLLQLLSSKNKYTKETKFFTGLMYYFKPFDHDQFDKL